MNKTVTLSEEQWSEITEAVAGYIHNEQGHGSDIPEELEEAFTDLETALTTPSSPALPSEAPGNGVTADMLCEALDRLITAMDTRKGMLDAEKPLA